jgi:hypothetical protein
LAALALIGAAACLYVIGLITGAVTFVGYQAKTEKLVGAARTSWWPIDIGVPVWLKDRQAIRADFDVDARFGAVTLTVAPPLWLRTSLQAATAYVEGKRAGSVLFVAEAAGWYTFAAAPTASGGPRCGVPVLDLKRMIVGDADCPVYDVAYGVTWRLASERDLVANTFPRLHIPPPNGRLATLRIRN